MKTDNERSWERGESSDASSETRIDFASIPRALSSISCLRCLSVAGIFVVFFLYLQFHSSRRVVEITSSRLGGTLVQDTISDLTPRHLTSQPWGPFINHHRPPTHIVNQILSPCSARRALSHGTHISPARHEPGDRRTGGAHPVHHAQAMSSTPSRPAVNGFHRPAHGGLSSSARRAPSMTRDGSSAPGLAPEEGPPEEDPVHEALQAQWKNTETRIAALFGAKDKQSASRRASTKPTDLAVHESSAEESAKTTALPKKAARQIDDDYGDDDEDEDEEDVEKQSPLKSKGKGSQINGTSTVPGVSTPVRAAVTTGKPLGSVPGAARPGTAGNSDSGQTSEDVRKQLEQEKKAAAEAARQSFQNMFYTLESDRDAMVEQQKLDELDREVEDEISGGPNAPATAPNSGLPMGATQGSLGSADLGASSLTLKHLIARLDKKRDMVKASDNQLRTLISEVRKGRSKWASEDRVGQEELYEAAEKVLMELKAMTEYAQPFLQRVSKREAPDYFNVIKTPMDIGTMIKKLKQYAYKSKKDFVDDLSLIWTNCLRYNQDPTHPLRKKALYMRNETDKITPLIPEVVIRDRAEIEAEERRLQIGDADDSDDDDAPIMASRGRKAPKKGVSSSARKAPPASADDKSTPAPDQKPALHASASNLRGDFLRADSDAPDVNSAGFNTPPPPGFATPHVNGAAGSGAAGSQADVMEVDGVGNSVLPTTEADLDEDDADFKTWKQVTKKDRAQAAAERNRLFRGEHLNPEEPALLRNKAMMRRWTRQQKMLSSKAAIDADAQEGADSTEPSAGGETLAEGIEKDEDSTLPDYYNPLSAIPDLDERWRWTTDSEGNAVPHTDEYMRMYPKGRYLSHQGDLTKKLEGNIRQMQETRKVCAKIGIVKQMQIQAQVRFT